MTKHTEIPVFGIFEGVRVAFSGISIACPFAATLMAENGADVVWLENPKIMDPAHSPYGFSCQERRNMRSMTLNIPSKEGREVFLKLMAETDIFLEGAPGCTFQNWGLGDDVLWGVNPKLVIVHVSGFGQSGDPEYVCRPSWDGIGQAFGGYMAINGYPEPEPPLRVGPYLCDYITALNACWSAAAALRKAERTGVGESIDIAQYEVMLRTQSDWALRYMNWGREAKRNANTDPNLCGYFPFKCGDGKFLFTAWVGATALRGGLPLLGYEWGSELFPNKIVYIQQGTEGAKVFFEAFTKWCADRTVEQAEKELLAAGVPCSQIMTYTDMQTNSHYQARQMFIEWDDEEFHGHVKGVGFAPKFTNNPQQLWRGMPRSGADTLDVLTELGYGPDEVQALEDAKAIRMPKVEPV